MSKSQNELLRDGTLKRADKLKVRLGDIHIEPGFNLGDRHEDDDADDAALLRHILAGGEYPPLEVRPRDEGGVFIIEGHRRFTQLDNAVTNHRDACAHLFDKNGEVWVDIKLVDGSYIARTARLLTSNESKKLTPLQIAEGYLRLATGGEGEDGLGPVEIAARVGKTRQHVDQMLHLARAPQAIKDMVAAGKISATEAMKLARAHKEQAAEAVPQVAGKVTGKTLKPWTPPAKYVAPLVQRMDAFVDALPRETLLGLTGLQADKESGRLPQGHKVSVDADALLALLNEFQAVVDARAEAKRKDREKQAKASQGELIAA